MVKPLPLSRLEHLGEVNPTSINKFVNRFRQKVATPQACQEMFDEETEKVRKWEIAAGVIIAIAGLSSMSITGLLDPYSLLILMGGIVLFVSGLLLQRRTPFRKHPVCHVESV